MFTHRAADLVDFPAILVLAAKCERYDKLARPLSEADLISSQHGEDPAHDWHLWHDTVGQLVASARLRLTAPVAQPVEGRFWLYVDPNVRGQGIETAMIAWAEAQTRAEAEMHGRSEDYRLMTAARDDKQERRDCLTQHGFHPVRYFFTMHSPFTAPLPDPVLPGGFTVRPVDAMRDLPAYVALGNAAFAEHWHHHDETEADMRSLMQDPGYRPELDLLAVAPDGTLAGFCTCTLEAVFLQRQSGFVLGLGTHPRYRGIGLGRALLIAGLQRLQALGLQGADISVDSENPSGAVKLYESVGFVTYETWITYFRP